LFGKGKYKRIVKLLAGMPGGHSDQFACTWIKN
jgi:hypothetical protein